MADTVIASLADVGASFEAVTVMLALAVADENAVEPPLVEVLAVLPALPLVPSQARIVRPAATVPFQFDAGTKRIAAPPSAASRRALASLAADRVCHVVPGPIVNCQLPFVLSMPVIAMPRPFVPSASLMRPATSVATGVPGFWRGSSSIADRFATPDSTGASLTAVTTIDAVADWLEYAELPPPEPGFA